MLSPHWQALKMLRTARLRPYIIFVRPPALERLAETRTAAHARSTFDKDSSRAFTVHAKKKYFALLKNITYRIQPDDEAGGLL